MQDSYLIVCDEQQKSYFSQVAKNEDFRFVVSEAEFEKLTADEVAVYHRIIIFAELLWQDKKYTDFYGIDIAALIRLKLKSLSPVAILSFLPQEYFGKNNEVKYNILNARGTCFLQLPVSFGKIESELSRITPLLSATLTYLSTLLIDVRYLVDVLTHDLRIEIDNDKICRSLRKMEQLSTTNVYPQLQKLSGEVISAHYERNESVFYTLKKELINVLNVYLQHTRKDTLPVDDKAKSKILLLDDNINDLQWAKNALSPYFEVIAFQDALEAKAHIEQDAKNELSAVICDWQLLKPNSREHQDMLGFEVLDYASKKGFYALFSLTSTDDFSIREIDALLNFEHQLFTKDFQQGEALWKLYIPIIQQKIDRVAYQIASIPTGTRWKTPKIKGTKSYHEQYLLVWNSIDWFVFENRISQTASDLWTFYQTFVKSRYSADKSLNDKGIMINSLENLLIARRIYLALWFSYTDKIKEDKNRYIYCDLNSNSDPDEGTINQFVNRLCFKSELLPQGILPEEKAWLNVYQIEIY
jgi:CheY-like chemotaxis protein